MYGLTMRRRNPRLAAGAILRYEGHMVATASAQASCEGKGRAVALLLGLGLLASLPQPAGAQLNPDTRPYDDKLLRLSEILGAIHYLRELCGAREGQIWREQMKNLLDAEGVTAIRRARLAKGFNKGYRGYRRTYRYCTEPAKVAADRFTEEGVALSEGLLKDNP